MSRKRGAALVTVLLMMVLLSMLSGAFLGVHQTNITLARNNDRYQEVYQACVSGVDYLWYRIENDKNFGKFAFRGTTTERFPQYGNPLLTADLIGDGVDPLNNRIEGEMLATGQRFTLRFVNNLGSAAMVEDGGMITPPNSVRVLSESSVESISRTLDTVLRIAPLVGYTALAGGQISIDLDAGANPQAGWWLETRDPARNSIRSNGNLYAPNSVDDPVVSRVQFRAPDGLAGRLRSPYGAAYSAQEIYMQNTMGSPTGHALGTSPTLRAQAENNADGMFSTGNGTVDVPEITINQLRSPAFPVNIDPGRYEFQKNGSIHSLVHYGSSGSPVTLMRFDENNIHGSPNRVLRSRYGDTIANINLQTRNFAIPPGVKVSSFGSLTFESREGAVPQISLGNAQQISMLSVTTGDLTVNGSVVGLGAVAAESGSVHLQAKSTLSTSPDFGVAVFAGETVSLDQPGAGAEDAIPGDWEAFRLALDGDDDLDDWMDRSEDRRAEIAEDFARETVVPEGGDFSTLWLGLVEEFGTADAAAANARDEWLRETVTITPTTTTGGSSTGPGPGGPGPGGGFPGGGFPGGGDDGGRADGRYDGGRDDGGTGADDGGTGGGSVVIDGGGGISMERYIRLREYFRSRDETWLDLEDNDLERSEDVERLLVNQVTFFQEMAGEYWFEVGPEQYESRWRDLSRWFRRSNPFIVPYRPDMAFKGLVYSKNFIFDANEKGIEIEGAIVTQEDLRIRNALGARFIYDPELLENLVLEPNLPQVKMERAFWNFR